MAGPDDLEQVESGSEEETEFATIAAAATLEEARRKALQQLRKVVPVVVEEDVDFVVLEEGSCGGLFGRGKVEVRVEARLRSRDEVAAADVSGDAGVLLDFIRNVVSLMGIEAHVVVSESADAVKAVIASDNLGLLIGRHGSTIDAIQHLAAIVVNGDRRRRRQVIVDAEGYRGRREQALTALADRTVQRVMCDDAGVALKPMTAGERKVIHLHLKDHPDVETYSVGSEPYRSVVIAPRGGASDPRPVDR